MSVQSVNPATGEVLETIEEMSRTQLEQAVAQAHAGFLEWRTRPFADRAHLMRAAAKELRANKAEFAMTMTREMGKPITQAEAEVEKCAGTCDYYAEHAEAFLAEQRRETDASRSYVRFDPLGVVLAVMPWNFPFWQVFRFAAPALMAGNGGILKHASNVPRCALQIEQVFRRAGFPEGLFRTVLTNAAGVKAIIADPRIVAVTLTGSERAGMAVAEQAGRMLKKTVLELGGSDPFIVLADADVDAAARAAADARLINSGQSCIAAKRFIVVEPVADRFLERFKAELGARRVGDPLVPGHRRSARRRAWTCATSSTRRSSESIKRGSPPDAGRRGARGQGRLLPADAAGRGGQGHARLRRGDLRPGGRGDRAPRTRPTRSVSPTTRPSASAPRSGRRDRARAERLAAQIEAGAVFVNGIVKSDPRLPFGGIKRSGYGRELSEYGIREFVNIKSVWIA